MNKYFFYSFSVVCLSTIFGCDGIAPKEQAQSTDISPTITSTPSALLSPEDSSAKRPTNSNSNYDPFHTPITQSVPVISSVVSEEEIAMREKQVKIAQENKRVAELRMKAGVGTQINMRRAEYFILSNKIQLLQAKKLLQLKQQQVKQQYEKDKQ